MGFSVETVSILVDAIDDFNTFNSLLMGFSVETLENLNFSVSVSVFPFNSLLMGFSVETQ